MKKIGLYTFCLLFTTLGFAQTEQNLLDFITFTTSFEKEVFHQNDSNEVLKLFLAISDDANDSLYNKINSEIQQLISELEELNITNKKPKKQLKTLFDFTHQKMLRKYEEEVNFEDIFKTSTYNCVTASALYSILLEHFNIPYHIIEEPTHVYVLTYPNTHQIILESTLPNVGFYAPSSANIEKAVRQLVAYKYITEQEVNTKGYEKAYHDYFYSDDPISLKRLASFQYYNTSVGKLDTELTSIEEIDRALNPIMKAQYLAHSDQNNLILYALLGSKMNLLKLDSLSDFKTVALFYANKRNYKNGSPTAYFTKSMKTELDQNGRVNFMKETYSYLKNNIEDTVELNREYFLGMSRYYMLASEHEKSLHYGKLGYQANPKDVAFHALIKHSIFSEISENGFSDDFETDIKSYEENYGPLLNQNKIFQGFKVNYKISLLAKKIESNRFIEGIKILNEIESDLNKLEKKPNYRREALAYIYAEYCAYFYRKGQLTKSKTYLNKGLEHDKNNAALVRKKDLLK